MTVRELDELIDCYDVWDDDRGYIGYKNNWQGRKEPMYEKPRRNGLPWYREYKAIPPWFKYEVIQIKSVSGRLTLVCRKP